MVYMLWLTTCSRIMNDFCFSDAGCLKVLLKMKILIVFDFDHTVVDDNCDIWVIKYVRKGLLHIRENRGTT